MRPTPEQLRMLFEYDPVTGALLWREGAPRGLAGKQAGSIDSKGRRRVEHHGRSYAAHQIAFAIHHGRWANGQVDHINRNKTDNRICNLREATNVENCCNRARRPGATGVRGVTLHKGRYIARVMIDGRSVSLGSFDSVHEASSAYAAGVIKYHGAFACPPN